MTQPVQEPSQGRTDQAQEFRTRQLFRRPAPSAPSFGRFTYIMFGPTDPVTPDAFADQTCCSFTLPTDLAEVGGRVITAVEAFVQTPSTSGVVELDVHRFWPDLAGSGQSIFVTNLTIDQDEFTSCTADVPPVISSPTFDACDYIVLQVVAEGTDTLGLGVHLTFGPVGS